MSEIQKIKPSGIFTNYIYKAIPLAFDESMSYYETLCGLLDLVNTSIDVINNNADLIAELESFVDNYFDNLDVQDEINNKLDEMATDGTLAEIINQEIFGEITDTLSLLTNKKFVLIGDSYLEGYTPDGNVNSWRLLFQTIFRIIR